MMLFRQLVVRHVALVMILAGCAGARPPRSAPPTPVAATPTSETAPAVPPPRDDGRLPAQVQPTRYALELVIDPARPTFTGRVRIGVVIKQPTRVIVLHGRGLTIERARLRSTGGELLAQSTFRMAARARETADELVLTFARPAPAGAAEIEIDYVAPFADGLRGVYRVNAGGDAYAFTQFEPNDARRAFPCFDEPGYKTPFDLAITVPAGAVAFANTREVGHQPSPGGDGTTFRFERSPPLPTYLVAFAVGALHVLEGPRAPTEVRLVAVKGRAGLGQLSIDAAAAHLELLGRYFDRPYPYAKLDLAAVPNFGAGAMENFGFVTFREELLLLDPARASMGARRAMASVMAHELAHQWFGDLVTMQWWDDLWLNEAFASWMSDKIVDQWRPQTRARVYAVGAKAGVMAEDALASVRRIRNPVRSTGEAEEAFDAITYGKGRAVLSMTEAWLGEDVFREGLRHYIKDHAWGNATAADLYAALAQASGGQPVAAVMDSFTGQTGAPQVSASLSCPPRGGATAATGARAIVHLRQREYRTLDQREPSDKLWRIPICVAYGNGAGGPPERQCLLLETAEGELPLARPGCPSFLYPNAGEAGYYRVQLSAAELQQLSGPSLARLSEPERFGLLNNAWAAVWSGDLPAVVFLDLLAHFKSETSKLVWGQIVEALTAADRALVSEAARPAFARLARELLGPTARRVGWEPKPGETDDQKLLRETMLGALGSLGDDEETLRGARRITDAWLSDPVATDPDLARIALPLAARRGDQSLFERLRAVLAHPATPEVRLLALAGLAGFEEPALVERVLALTLDGTIKAQDFRYVILPLGARRPTRDLTFAWIQRHFDQLTAVMPTFLRRQFTSVAAGMCDRQRVQEVETFLRPRLAKLEGAEKNAQQAIEVGLRCAALADKEAPATSRWLLGRR